MYATVRIPGRSAPHRSRRESTKATPGTADLQRLMADLDLRRQVASATSAALPPIPNGSCIGDIAADMADVMLSIAAELAPRSKRPRGAQGADPGVQAEMNAAWQQREEARRSLRADPNNGILRKAVKIARRFARPPC